MARRKRLTPARAFTGEGEEGAVVSPVTPPIAQIAGQSATEAAFQEVAGEMARAREEGRLIQMIPLDAIAEDHLVRDRIGINDEDMAALVASIQARGQRTPIEVIETAPGAYGLISGWRRLQALRRLRGTAAPDDGRFTRVRALVTQPRDAGEAYVAMVEENEIRADLSHYERARIVARSVGAGAFADVASALKTLFANASRAKRSKIKSFMTLVEQLDDVLRYPAHLGERLGLELAGRMNEEPGFAGVLAEALSEADPQNPEEEGEAIRAALQPVVSRAKQESSARTGKAETGQEIAPGIRLASESKPGRLVLIGPGVDEALYDKLRLWLRSDL